MQTQPISRVLARLTRKVYIPARCREDVEGVESFANEDAGLVAAAFEKLGFYGCDGNEGFLWKSHLGFEWVGYVSKVIYIGRAGWDASGDSELGLHGSDIERSWE